jgi:hypothetical protein
MQYFILEVDSTNCKTFFCSYFQAIFRIILCTRFLAPLIYNISENFIVLEQIFFQMLTEHFFFSPTNAMTKSRRKFFFYSIPRVSSSKIYGSLKTMSMEIIKWSFSIQLKILKSFKQQLFSLASFWRILI